MRWAFVGGVGVLCGVILGGLLYLLTASVIAAAVVGLAVASILLVLAWGGFRHNETFNTTPDLAREAEAKRQRVQQAIEESRRTGDA
jgi:hypothetical protein